MAVYRDNNDGRSSQLRYVVTSIVSVSSRNKGL